MAGIAPRRKGLIGVGLALINAGGPNGEVSWPETSGEGGADAVGCDERVVVI